MSNLKEQWEIQKKEKHINGTGGWLAFMHWWNYKKGFKKKFVNKIREKINKQKKNNFLPCPASSWRHVVHVPSVISIMKVNGWICIIHHTGLTKQKGYIPNWIHGKLRLFFYTPLHPLNSVVCKLKIIKTYYCFYLKISCNDGLPQKICTDCYSKFCTVSAFRMQCLEAQQILSNIFDKIDTQSMQDDDDDVFEGIEQTTEPHNDLTTSTRTIATRNTTKSMTTTLPSLSSTSTSSSVSSLSSPLSSSSSCSLSAITPPKAIESNLLKSNSKNGEYP